MANEVTGRDSDKFMLRLPDGMRDRLKSDAEANKRSMNAEIVARLEKSGRSEADEREIQELKDLTVELSNIIKREFAYTHAIYAMIYESTLKIVNGEPIEAKDIISDFAKIGIKFHRHDEKS